MAGETVLAVDCGCHRLRPVSYTHLQARDIQGQDYKVVSVIGDGALTGGMAYEALNNAARMKKNFIIVLNDNNMSISENVGGMSRYLGGIRTGSHYNDLKKNVADALDRIPVVGTVTVSYTHLDVYKRQPFLWQRDFLTRL